MKLNDVRFVNVIRFKELSVKHLYDHFMGLPGLTAYFPDSYPVGR